MPLFNHLQEGNQHGCSPTWSKRDLLGQGCPTANWLDWLNCGLSVSLHWHSSKTQGANTTTVHSCTPLPATKLGDFGCHWWLKSASGSGIHSLGFRAMPVQWFWYLCQQATCRGRSSGPQEALQNPCKLVVQSFSSPFLWYCKWLHCKISFMVWSNCILKVVKIFTPSYSSWNSVLKLQCSDG